ncbi:uncharacterized protein B0I36DRAFT_46274 [Microdochium trichocladiopsis]|uniref:Secreted protein n=1 Tax=Microdochium trichocladiopsis TaxID=1682393 RepID=A0A9P8XT33_9PEZI|nr:uncharacterized protein B0I36DRAFT_46274 [Microdochium trichocladiopsis]KAH7016453.1 hypothetical protein B0I36DRAFT_46274 [Microdochium trichocladiopsis]
MATMLAIMRPLAITVVLLACATCPRLHGPKHYARKHHGRHNKWHAHEHDQRELAPCRRSPPSTPQWHAARESCFA